MPDTIKISELNEALALADAAEFPYSQENGGERTTFKAPLTQIAAKIVEDMSFAGIDLPAGAGVKSVENTLNYLLGAVGGNPNENIATEYDPTETYAKGDVAIYENVLYICTASNGTTGTFDPSKWTATTIDNVIGDLSSLTTSEKSSLVGAVNEVDTELDTKVPKADVNRLKVKSGSPAEIGGVGAYASMILMGFCQGVGAVAVLVMVDGNAIGSVINLKNGQAFSNANLTFSYSNATQKITVSSTNASESSYVYIIGGIRY